MRNWLRNWLGITALEARVGGFTVEQKAESATIAEWLLEREKHPPGSPKHTAYTNRLRGMGVLSGDRHEG